MQVIQLNKQKFIIEMEQMNYVFLISRQVMRKRKENQLLMSKRTSKECTIPLTVGGGINNIRDIDELLNSGADKVSVNTAAVKDHKLIKKEAAKKIWITMYSSCCRCQRNK